MPLRRLRGLLRRREERTKREDWRFAFLAAVVVNALGASKEPVQAEDLMPWLQEKKKAMSPDEMVALLKNRFPKK